MEQEPEADSCFGTLLQALLTTFLLSYSLFSFFTSPQPTSNFVRLQMPRASLRQTLPLNFQLLSIIAQQQSTSTSLSLGLALSWPFMERFFGTAVLGRQAAACREPASLWDASRTGALHCAWDGWMDGRCGETLRLRAREEAVWDGLRRGLCRISPKAKSKNILSCPAGLRGLLGVTCCSDAAVRLIASVIRAMQVVRTACHLGYTVLPQSQSSQKYAGKQNCVCDHSGLQLVLCTFL